MFISIGQSCLSLRRPLLLPLASVALILASCGSDDAFGKRYSVTGTVSYNGQPLEKGTISFVPEKGTSATGIIDHGSYALSTGGDRDGALPGTYKVTIAAKEDTEALAKAQFAKLSKRPEAEITAIPRQIMVNAAASARSLVPVGYGDLRTTTLTATVKEQSNVIAFTISDADAPPEPPKAGVAKGRR